MKKQSFLIILMALFITGLSSCEVIGGIFKAGVGVGIFIVVFVVALIVFLISRAGGSK